MMEAVLPPLLLCLVENKKLKFGGEASVRTAGASVPSHVSVRRRLSSLLSKIRSLVIKVLFKRERTFSTAMLMLVPNARSSWRFKGIKVLGLKTVRVRCDLLKTTVGMLWVMLSRVSVGRGEVCEVCGEWAWPVGNQSAGVD